jgi:uncharacterized protein YkwD
MIVRKLRVACGVLVLLLVVATVSRAQAGASPDERSLFTAANRERREQGLPALKWNDALAGAARQHAQEMARENTVAHVLPGEASLPGRATKAGVKFSSLSENIVQSASAEGARSQFMKSRAHRANILDRDMDSVGIGVAERGGHLFVVEDFAKSK